MATNSRSSTQYSISSGSTTLFSQGSNQSLTPNSSTSNVSLVPGPSSKTAKNTATMPPRPVGAPFRAALSKFKARLTGVQIMDFQATTYDTLCFEIMRIQHEQENSKTMKNLNRIKGFIEAMSQFGTIVEVFLNVSNVIAFLWGPMKFLLLTAHTFAESFEVLLDAYERIGEQLPLLADYEALFSNSPRMLNVLELMYMDILTFHQDAMRFFSGNLWKKLLKSIWKDFEWEKDLNELKVKTDSLIESDRNMKIKAVQEWLGTNSQAQIKHEKCRGERVAATGDWILDHDIVKHWMLSSPPGSPLVWINGIPGAGKTILASIIIDKCISQQDCITSYVYCGEGVSESNTAVAIIRTIVGQVIHQHKLLVPYCHLRSTTIGEPMLRTFSTARKLLEDICIAVPNQHYMIIDGLDECETAERKLILETIMQILGKTEALEEGKLRVLIISQDWPDIKRHLQLHSSVNPANSAQVGIIPKSLTLSPDDNEKDIRTYVSDMVNQIKQFHSLDDAQVEYLRELTMVRANGMFLYAKLVMTNLLAQPTRADLLEEIHIRFPEKLKDALLGWLVCAKRQLTWKEIQVALSMDFEDQAIYWENHRFRIHIYDICGSLVQVSGDRVYLVHSTAKEYITTCTENIHEPSVECELATICLQYLTFPVFDKDEYLGKGKLRDLAMEGHLAFQDYAVAKWFFHVNDFVQKGGAFVQNGGNIFSTGFHEVTSNLGEVIDEFMMKYESEEWSENHVPDCAESCNAFEKDIFYDHLMSLTSHIYTFQKKGFEARHKISIGQLAEAFQRNRKLLEELPDKLDERELKVYEQFYDHTNRYKCPRITCMYFFQGFKDHKSRKKHVNIHDRPFQCDASECIASECGFANSKDLEKHKRTFHPELSDLAEAFKPHSTPKGDRLWSCSICGKSFTRNFHKKSHENSHRGIRPHSCKECGKTFVRSNDCRRHQKLHDRK
ncbi:C2H2 domain-containing protein [Dendryphion nanum]|uniref:C2H2 domain-containing protein n=1 Tax=Dendryphion nanum TaxID=256645 RepID=A0A9P9DNL7_9PLEO|nr:C2H2 domain-containing protein [Dendryphion nanum]